MIRDIDVLYDTEKKEYVIVSEGYKLVLTEEEFQAIRSSINGISYAIQQKIKRMREQASTQTKK